MNHKNTTQSTSQYAGVDIAKDTLEVDGFQMAPRYDNTSRGISQLIHRASQTKGMHLVFEATGGYEQALLKAAHQAKLTVSLVDARRVRAYATALGLKAKTDKLDARVLTSFGQAMKPAPTPPRASAEEDLAALRQRHTHLSDQLAREKNRQQKSPALIQKSISRMIRHTQKELDLVDQSIRKLIASDPKLSQASAVMQTVCGIGEVTAWTLLAYLPEILDPQTNRGRLASLAGLVPYNNDSGKSQKPRHIQGGRAKIRKTLYMAAKSAAQHNPVIREYVRGLVERGKPYQSALVAAMRKLILHIHALLKNPQNCVA